MENPSIGRNCTILRNELRFLFGTPYGLYT